MSHSGAAPIKRRTVEQEAAIERPTVQLLGLDGNVFSIIGRTNRALKAAGKRHAAAEFTNRAFASGSYDAVLRLVMEYCDVE